MEQIKHYDGMVQIGFVILYHGGDEQTVLYLGDDLQLMDKV
jgi:hypothetical protein